MTVLQALVLGIVQGLTEFLPVSSSAHLNIFPWVFGWTIPESFDVALHIGTLLAMIIFFFRDWISLFKGGFGLLFKKKKSKQGSLFWIIVAATAAGAVLSLILDKISKKIIGDNINLEMILIAAALIIMGVILCIVDSRARSKIRYDRIDFKRGLFIGMSQGIAAAFPGVSRSGITMTVGRAFGITRESAAKFSFMLAAPITLAAIIFELDKFVFDLPFVVGVLSSFIVGLLVIKFLLDFLKKRSFIAFGIYRVILGIVVIVICIVKMA